MIRGFPLSVVMSLMAAVFIFSAAQASENMLKDPGFERYHYDRDRQIYVPDANAAWVEYGRGELGVRLNMGTWKAPEEMEIEGSQGFTPGTGLGQIIFQQDLVDASLFRTFRTYEAWVWLGGSGKDDDTNSDEKDEVGGFDAFFYDNTNTASWSDDNALEVHHVVLDYFGEPESFVRVSGFGRTPHNTVGVRIRFWASTWAVTAAKIGTQVALDNAHFALMQDENLLGNGDFEEDTDFGPFHQWQRPAAWPFPAGDFVPRDVRNVYGPNIDHGTFRPYFGDWHAYGYVTYLDGWTENSFSFGQTVDWDEPPGTVAALMCYWLQDVQYDVRPYLMRDIGGALDFAVRFLNNNTELGFETRHVDWPVPPDPSNKAARDYNGGRAYNPRIHLIPPEDTNRIELSVNVSIDMLYAADRPHVSFLVDEFYLGSAGFSKAATTTRRATFRLY